MSLDNLISTPPTKEQAWGKIVHLTPEVTYYESVRVGEVRGIYLQPQNRNQRQVLYAAQGMYDFHLGDAVDEVEGTLEGTKYLVTPYQHQVEVGFLIPARFLHVLDEYHLPEGENEDPLFALVQKLGSHDMPGRRRIVDVTSRVKYFFVADSDQVRLGDHYHQHTRETFYSVEGKFRVRLEDIETKELQELTVEPGQQIEIPLLVAHTVFPEPEAQFIAALKTPFDKDDLHKYPITW